MLFCAKINSPCSSTVCIHFLFLTTFLILGALVSELFPFLFGYRGTRPCLNTETPVYVIDTQYLGYNNMSEIYDVKISDLKQKSIILDVASKRTPWSQSTSLSWSTMPTKTERRRLQDKTTAMSNNLNKSNLSLGHVKGVLCP